MKKSTKIALAAIITLLLTACTAFITYRYTMTHIDIDTSDDNTVYLTVFGQTDVYTLDK